MEIKGKIKFIDTTKTYGNKGFQKREIVIQTEEKYPQLISIEFVNDNTTLLDSYKTEQDVVVGINLKGREWVSPENETKYFNSIQGWRIDAYTPEEPQVQEQETEEEASEDLPF